MKCSGFVNSVLMIVVTANPFVAGAQSVTERVSVSTGGLEGDDSSTKPNGISADGRFVVFASIATNLIPNDTNDQRDVFVRDRQAGETIRANVASDGTESNGYSDDPSISADGRYVAFYSRAANLVSGDTNESSDIFVHDLWSAETWRVSVATDGTQANGDSFNPRISRNGRYVAFESDATNLGGDGAPDVFVHDLQTGETALVTDNNIGPPYTGTAPVMSADGRYVAFIHQAGDCPFPFDYSLHAYVIDRQTSTLTPVSVDSGGNLVPCSKVDRTSLSISADGRQVVFEVPIGLVPDDTNGNPDVYVYDLGTSTIERVSLWSDGSQIDQGCDGRSMSDDGRFVTLQCKPTGFLPPDDIGFGGDDNHVFVLDRLLGTTTSISLAYNNFPGENAGGGQAQLSADGRFVAYSSEGRNLVPDDNNEASDIFIWDNSRIFSGTFESGNDCHWSGSQGGLGCPAGISATGFITAYPRDSSHHLVDRAVFTLRDGFNPGTTFEIDADGSGVSPGNVAIDLNGAPFGPAFPGYALPILISVISAVPNLDITPSLYDDTKILLTNDAAGAAGNRNITGGFSNWLVFSYEGMSGGVDPRP